MTVNSIVLAMTILISLIMVYTLLRYGLKANQVNSLFGVIYFVIAGFLLFKTTDSCTYLYWQYNVCTIYYYSVPSYLASAYIILLIMDRSFKTEEKEKRFVNKGFLGIAAYLLTFSFIPAATLVAVVAFWYLLDDFILSKNIIKTVKRNGLYVAILIFYCIALYMEFGRTFGTGYFSADGDFLNGVKVSFKVIIESFLAIHPMIQIISIAILLFFVIVWNIKRREERIFNNDKKYNGIIFYLLRTVLSMFCFFILFGAVSLGHIVRDGMPLRMDSMYVFYFLVIFIITICLVYLLENSEKARICMPLILFLMLYPTISPKYSYSESFYVDSTARQKYEIMSEIVEAAKEENLEGNVSVKAAYSLFNLWRVNGIYFVYS